MSQAEELLNSMTTRAVPTPVPSEDLIRIDDDRVVHVPESLQRLGVQYDHNIETVTFRAPRYWDGRDLSFMKIYINYMRADGVRGQHIATNLQVDSVLDIMTFDWVISNHVTPVKGKISFLVCAVSTDADGNELRHWNSELNQECYISEGLECEDFILEAYPDVITQLLLRMDEVERLIPTDLPTAFYVTVSDYGDGIVAPNASYEAITAAYNAGHPVIAILEELDENIKTVLGAGLCFRVNDMFVAQFIDSVMQMRYVFIRSDSCECMTTPIESSLLVTITGVSDDGKSYTYTADHTEQQIVNAHNAGLIVVCKLVQDGIEVLVQLSGAEMILSDDGTTLVPVAVFTAHLEQGIAVSITLLMGEIVVNYYVPPAALPNPESMLIDNVVYNGANTVDFTNVINAMIASKISAIPTPDVSGQIREHNASTASHDDIRMLISDLAARLNTLSESDETTLQQMTEMVAYIESNKDLIDSITTGKVNVSDIINNLTTNVANKPLSAAQGVVLKALIDAITVPTKVSELINDKGYLVSYTETDPTVPAWAKSPTKPKYTASEVGALPNTTVIPIVPSKLPNPNKLTLTGSVSAEYDGSTPVQVEIPKGHPYVLVTDYGAKGNGSTNDTAAFQAALAENRVVHVPGGTYVLSGELVIHENCCLELSQDAVLKFTQTSGNCITLLRLAHLDGNHATIFVPYTFGGRVINCDTAEDEAVLDQDNLANDNATAVPPFKKWDPQWKMSRYVTDINICKPNSSGFHYSNDGTCYGTAVYMGCSEGVADFMWGVSILGLRICGGFTYGIHLKCEGETWNHDGRIEAVMDACEIGVLVENTNYTRLAVTIQPRKAADDTVYAKHGIKLVDAKSIDLSSSRVWDWNATYTLWKDGGEYQHIAMYGQCRGLIVDDFLYHEASSYDIRDLIHTDTASNLEKMTVLQEPITRWFKPVDSEPYFFDGYKNRRLAFLDDVNGVDEFFETDRVPAYSDAKSPYRENIWDNSGTLTSVPSSIYIEPKEFSTGDVIRIRGVNFTSNYPGKAFAYFYYKGSGEYKGKVNLSALITASTVGTFHNGEASYEWDAETDTLTVRFNTSNSASFTKAYVYAFGGEYAAGYNAESVIMTVNEEIAYAQAGFLSDGVKVKGDNVYLYSPSGKAFNLTVSDSGALTVTEVTV